MVQPKVARHDHLTRRQLLRHLAGAGLSLAAAYHATVGAHTPYRQWEVYRRKHLLIGCHKDEAATYDLAREVVATLDHHLPAASARVARGPTAGRLASLLATAQLDVAIVRPIHASAMASGTADFEPYGAIDLRLLVPLDRFVLICRADFPADHAWLLAEALNDLSAQPSSFSATWEGRRWHSGARAYRQGLQQP